MASADIATSPDDSILTYIPIAWGQKVEAGLKARKPFDDIAALASALHASPNYKQLPGVDRTATDMGVAFPEMSYNITAHFVTTFGPMLYHEDPVRTVTKRDRFSLPGSPMAQQQEFMDQVIISLVSQELNYTPREHGLKRESSRAIIQGLITGRGCLWTEMSSRTGLPGSYYDSVKNLYIDPDATTIENAHWIAHRRILPLWYVRQRFNLGEEIHADTASAEGEADSRAEGHRTRQRLDHTADTVTVYEIFSKMGWGARLAGANPDLKAFEAMATQMAGIGDNLYLVIAPNSGMHRPLNVHPEMDLPTMQAATRWPIEFWQDDVWPVSVLDFFEVPGNAWPMAPIQQVRGQVLFLNWAYGRLAGKVKTTCRDFIALSKTLAPEVEGAIKTAEELAVLLFSHDEMTQAGGVKNLIDFLQHPEFKRDIYTVLQLMEDDVKAKLGLTELVTGQVSQQYRTTTEATARTEYSRVKPDAMADAVEEWQTQVGRKEALAARVMLRATQTDAAGMRTLTPFGQFLGAEAAGLWDNLVATDMKQAATEYEYRIEAGSARKPNKYREVDNAHMLANQFGATAASLLMAGDPAMHNALVDMLTRAMDYDPGALMLSNEQAKALQQMGMQAAGPPGGQMPNQPGQALPGGSPAGTPPPTRPEQSNFQLRTA